MAAMSPLRPRKGDSAGDHRVRTAIPRPRTVDTQSVRTHRPPSPSTTHTPQSSDAGAAVAMPAANDSAGRPSTGGSRPGSAGSSVRYTTSRPETAGSRPGTAGSVVKEVLEFDTFGADLPFSPAQPPLPGHTSSSPIAKADKQQTLAQIKSLGIRAVALERDALSRLRSRAGGSNEYEDVRRTAEHYMTTREVEQRKLSAVLEKIQADAIRFRTMLQNVSSAPSFVQRVQRLMEAIESAILKLKDEQHATYTKLVAQEKLATREVAAYATRFEAWKHNQDAMTEARGRRRGTDFGAGGASGVPTGVGGRNVPPEVKELEIFVTSSGGLTGGWSQYDHGVFLQERLRHRSPAAAVSATSAKLVGHAETEVQAHEAWYARYLELVDKKKAAIARWRAEKRKALESEQHGSHHRAEVQQKLEHERKAAAIAAADEERQRKANDVAQWKAEKEARRREEETEKRAAMKVKAEAKRSKEKGRRRQERAMVQSFTEQREADEARRREAAEIEAAEQARRAPTAAELAYFRARDEAAYQDQLQQRHAVAQAVLEKAERLERIKRKVRVEAPRDPSRLTRATASTRARENDTTKSGGQMITRAAPKLAVPSWRKGM